MKKLLSMKQLFVRSVVLLALMGIFAGNSYLYADTHFSDYADANVCTFCIFSRSKKEKTGNKAPTSTKVPTSNNQVCLSHAHCHQQPAAINTFFLVYSDSGDQFESLGDTLAPFQLTASIFRPPKIHI